MGDLSWAHPERFGIDLVTGGGYDQRAKKHIRPSGSSKPTRFQRLQIELRAARAPGRSVRTDPADPTSRPSIDKTSRRFRLANGNTVGQELATAPPLAESNRRPKNLRPLSGGADFIWPEAVKTNQVVGATRPEGTTIREGLAHRQGSQADQKVTGMVEAVSKSSSGADEFVTGAHPPGIAAGVRLLRADGFIESARTRKKRDRPDGGVFGFGREPYQRLQRRSRPIFAWAKNDVRFGPSRRPARPVSGFGGDIGRAMRVGPKGDQFRDNGLDQHPLHCSSPRASLSGSRNPGYGKEAVAGTRCEDYHGSFNTPS